MTFDAVCQLEENGVYLLNLDRRNPKLATMIRGLVAWVTGLSLQEASAEIEAHIKNGGNAVEVFGRIMKSMETSGFFANQQPPKAEVVPMDHQRKKQKGAKPNTTTPSES